MDLSQIAQNCVRDFVASYDGQQPTVGDMRIMLQQSTGIDVEDEEAAQYLQEATKK